MIATQSIRRLPRTATPEVEPRQHRSNAPDLIECAEYEWSRPMSLPGLIAKPDVKLACSATVAHSLEDELIDSEDGDVSHAFQFPGKLQDE